MLIVMGVIEFEDGGVEQAREAIATMEQKTRKEDGCLVYTFSQEISSPNTVRISEQWASMDALALHLKTSHMADFGAEMGRIGLKSMDVKLYEIAGERELPR